MLKYSPHCFKYCLFSYFLFHFIKFLNNEKKLKQLVEMIM